MIDTTSTNAKYLNCTETGINKVKEYDYNMTGIPLILTCIRIQLLSETKKMIDDVMNVDEERDRLRRDQL